MKSREKTWQVRGILSQQLEHKQVPLWGKEPGVRKGKLSLLACHTHCKLSMERPLIIGEGQARYQGHENGGKSDRLTVGQGLECHLTFVRGIFHIAE